MPFYKWSKTAASNGLADSTCPFPEQMAASAYNDGMRGAMAAIAQWRDDVSGGLLTTGTASAYALATNSVFSALADCVGQKVAFTVHATNAGAAVTLATDSVGAKPLRSSPGVELLPGVLLIGTVNAATYFTSNGGEWILDAFPTLGDLQIGSAKLGLLAVLTSKIADAAVTLAKMESRATQTLLGRWSVLTGVPQEVSIGAGLVLNATTGVLTAPAFPPAGAFKSLSIKVASNTTVAVLADYVATTDGANFQTTALAGTINLGTAGVANALDAGAIAANTWYAIFAIAKPDGTTAGLASLSGTAPTMPTGYTFKARIGWVRTATGSAQLLGTWQLGRRVQYVIGLAQTTGAIYAASGAAGSATTNSVTWTAPSVANIVPSTASMIFLTVVADRLSTGAVLVYVAPNVNYGPTQGTNPPPLCTIMQGGAGATGGSFSGSFMLEGSTIAYATAASATAGVVCNGWEDNI